MSTLLYGKNPFTSALLLKLREIGKLPSDEDVASRFPRADPQTVDAWVMGDTLPPLELLPQLAEIANVDHGALVLAWLTDTDRKNKNAYDVIALQLLKAGGPTANPFFVERKG